MQKTLSFRIWGKSRGSRRRSWAAPSKKDRSRLAGVDPRGKQRALDSLALIREYNRRLLNRGGLKTKEEVIEKFVGDVNAGMLRPEGAQKFVSHISRSGIYNLIDHYKKDGIRGLVPRYKYKENPSAERPIFRPAAKPFEMKFPGRPRRNGKADLVERIKRRFKSPPSEYPIRLAIYYAMPIPAKIKMRKRMKYFRAEISHTRRPNLDALNAFIVDCLTGVVFKSHSQIVHFHSEKKFAWWPEIRIVVRELKG